MHTHRHENWERRHKYLKQYELWRNGYNSRFSSGFCDTFHKVIFFSRVVVQAMKGSWHYTYVDNTAIESERAWQENWNGWKTNDLKSICKKYDLAF